MAVKKGRWCVVMFRLRDLSAQDKMENQRVLKDLEKTSTELNEVRERNEKLIQEVQVSLKCPSPEQARPSPFKILMLTLS